jgi:hypothetical protein
MSSPFGETFSASPLGGASEEEFSASPNGALTGTAPGALTDAAPDALTDVDPGALGGGAPATGAASDPRAKSLQANAVSRSSTLRLVNEMANLTRLFCALCSMDLRLMDLRPVFLLESLTSYPAHHVTPRTTEMSSPVGETFSASPLGGVSEEEFSAPPNSVLTDAAPGALTDADPGALTDSSSALAGVPDALTGAPGALTGAPNKIVGH